MNQSVILNSLLTIAFVFVAINFSGCATSTQGIEFDINQVKNIKTGVTTKSEVLDLFGPPITKQIDQTGRENWHYNHATSSLNIFSLSPSKTDTKSLLISFINDVVQICQVAYGKGINVSTVPCDKY